ncbi:PPOX class F420-dependent oxidoreductase [Actinomadura parmotrematis]|uniref:PPOX class F420-dependent oxidoreductase n=1 Tax=Actinomadura parmotrematis TaxID=2864039 RepID=A0ABS7FL15_9ACTN|nr:PPOX class F420-dependent oxidoreductase [Actinomadura parmotrematis]MBW8481051.1 PPOX class F420-dependent oxidoreductase [Actinomadura parmotrematis]
MSLTDTELAYLRTQRLGRLATVAAGGDPQNNPVGFRYDAAHGTIDIYGWNMAASRKFRNVQGNPRVAFVVDDIASVDPWTVRGVEIRGRAEAVAGHAPSDGHLSGDVIRVHPETVFSWGIDPDAKGMTRRVVEPAG